MSQPTQAGYNSLSRRSFIAAAEFDTQFFNYTTSVSPKGVVTGTLAPVQGASPGTCPAGRVLRETGRKLYSGVNPGIVGPMIAVYDEVSLLTGYIDPNSPVFAVYNTENSYTTPRGYNPVPVDGVYQLNSGPPIYSQGPIIGSYVAGAFVVATLYNPSFPLVPYNNTTADAYAFINPYLANVFQVDITSSYTALTGTIHCFLRDSSTPTSDLVPPSGELLSVIFVNTGAQSPTAYWEPGTTYGFYSLVTPTITASTAHTFGFSLNGINAFMYDIGSGGGSSLPAGINKGDYLYYNGATWVTGFSTISIGDQSGKTNQGESAVAVGAAAGYLNQGINAIAIGQNAGLINQSTNAVAIGQSAGQSTQGANAVGIGYTAGQSNQGSNAVAIGYTAGQSNQGANALAIGYTAGQTTQGIAASAFGNYAGVLSQGSGAVAVGNGAGNTSQGNDAVAVGNNAGNTTQGSNAVAVGISAGILTQGIDTVAIGNNAGNTSQGYGSIAIGYTAGSNTQGTTSIAIGYAAGSTTQLQDSIAIGNGAGSTTQSDNCIAIGTNAGANNQGNFSGNKCIAIGTGAGQSNQGNDSIAIGNSAGQMNQGLNCIAIGYGAATTNQADNSIVLDANGLFAINPTTPGFFVKPISLNDGSLLSRLAYDTGTGEITYDTTKTFVIQHPKAESKYLVHACLEGPEAGVYYRGKGTIHAGEESATITLPDYVDALATEFTINVTPIYNKTPRLLNTSEIEHNQFQVFGPPGNFYWHVYGKRQSVNVEPDKATANVQGTGPYRWIA